MKVIPQTEHVFDIIANGKRISSMDVNASRLKGELYSAAGVWVAEMSLIAKNGASCGYTIRTAGMTMTLVDISVPDARVPNGNVGIRCTVQTSKGTCFNPRNLERVIRTLYH